ncbi:hypothetical protein AB0N07_49310 [Streptomyces sp. NPDC051172]|uniref:hypothetical protein n=1 Tax=Streptomyces sp. NPDC051172 TaxID=3155796 RepID=UPI0034447AF4
MNEPLTADGPRGRGMGAGSYASPYDIPADSNLRHAVALPFYQKHGIYLQKGGDPIHVQGGGARELTISNEETTTQTIPRGGGSDDWRNTLKSVVGIAVKTAENALRAKYPALPDGAISGLLGFGTSSADSVRDQKTVTFGVKDTIKIVPLIGRTIIARPVFFKVKSVSDEWVREGGALKLVRGSIISDVVVKQGWILECPTAGGGMRIARQMPTGATDVESYDYMADTMLNIPTPPDPQVDECAPPTEPPDRTTKDEEQKNVRAYFSKPRECSTGILGGGRRIGGWEWGTGRDNFTGISVLCPPPKGQGNPRTYECYRIKYYIEGQNEKIYPEWDARSAGTVSFANGMREIGPWESDERTMAKHEGIPADGGEYKFDFKYRSNPNPEFASPKVHVDIIPIK